MTTTDGGQLAEEHLDALAWDFLRSEFAGHIYADWPIDRRLDAYLLHNGPGKLFIDGSTYNELLDNVMANIGPALRKGILSPQSTNKPKPSRTSNQHLVARSRTTDIGLRD